jgi:hypothetical protein
MSQQNKSHLIRERKVRTLTKNLRVYGGQAHEHTHGNKIEICRRTRLSFSIRRERMYLLIEKDGCVRRHISILFPCVCSCACPPWIPQFSVRVLTFLSLILCYSYFGTFLSMWSKSHLINIYIPNKKDPILRYMHPVNVLGRGFAIWVKLMEERNLLKCFLVKALENETVNTKIYIFSQFTSYEDQIFLK